MKLRRFGTQGLVCLAISICGVGVATGMAATIRENAGASGFQMLEEPVSPRRIAMGAAGSASPGSGFAYYNPALPFLTDRPSVTVEYGQHPAADLHYANFETTWRIRNFFTGLSVHTQSLVDIIPSTINGVNDETPGSWQTTTLSINAGYALGPAAVALSFNGVQDRILTDAAYALTLSGGAIWAAIPDKLSLGIAAFHWGKTSSYLDTTERFDNYVQLPQTGRLGAHWCDQLGAIRYSAALDVVYRRTDGRFMVPVGVEVWPLEALAVRMGKRIGHDVDKFSLGVGLRLEPLAVDFSFVIPQYENDTELKWLMGVTYTLKKKAPLPPVKKAPVAAQDALPIAVPVPLAPATSAAPAAAADSVVATDSIPATPASPAADRSRQAAQDGSPAAIPADASAAQSPAQQPDHSLPATPPAIPAPSAPAPLSPLQPVSDAADSVDTSRKTPQPATPPSTEETR